MHFLTTTNSGTSGTPEALLHLLNHTLRLQMSLRKGGKTLGSGEANALNLGKDFEEDFADAERCLGRVPTAPD